MASLQKSRVSPQQNLLLTAKSGSVTLPIVRRNYPYIALAFYNQYNL